MNGIWQWVHRAGSLGHKALFHRRPAAGGAFFTFLPAAAALNKSKTENSKRTVQRKITRTTSQTVIIATTDPGRRAQFKTLIQSAIFKVRHQICRWRLSKPRRKKTHIQVLQFEGSKVSSSSSGSFRLFGTQFFRKLLCVCACVHVYVCVLSLSSGRDACCRDDSQDLCGDKQDSVTPRRRWTKTT